MYFSKNSRYVLQKAHVLSPNLFKVTEKNLSVKTPSDDPSKPPLRINIPKDGVQEEAYHKRLQSAERQEGRSKSFTSGPRVASIATTFDDGLLQKCESEMRFPNFVTDNILIGSDLSSTSVGNASPLDPPALSNTNYSMEVDSKDYNDGLRTTLQDETTATALCRNYLEKEPLFNSQANISEMEESNPQSIYIIIDVPEGEEKALESRNEIPKEAGASERHDFDSPVTDAKQMEMDAFVTSSKSYQKNPHHEEKPKQTRRFEIEEIEDTATYVFHLKLNNKARKLSKLSCVPEKEVSVRNLKPNAEDAAIKVSQSGFTGTVNPRPREVSSLDEFHEFSSHQNASKKYKVRKAVEAKKIPRLYGDEFEDTRSRSRYMERSAHLREERKSPPKFERDDFGTIRAAKNYPFALSLKPSVKQEEARAEELQEEHREELQMEHREEHQEELSQVEPSPERMELSSDAQPQVEVSGAEAQVDPFAEAIPESLVAKTDSRYLNVKELDGNGEKESGTAEIQQVPEPVEKSSPYFSIHELKKEKTIDKSKINDHMDPKKKQFSQNSSDFARVESEAISFQSCVSIESEKVSYRPSRFSPAFPPLLNEVLKNRFRFNKPNLLDGKLGISLKSSKGLNDCSKSSKVKQLMENSILFPKKECEKFDCESFFTTREELIASIIKNSEEENKQVPGVGKKPLKSTSECSTEKLYADNLTVMKKVKEMVQFDLDNVVKIFNDGKPKEVASVVISNGDGWKIDSEELKKEYEKAADRMRDLEKKSDKEVPSKTIDGQYHPTKYLPTTMVKKNEMKLLDDEDSTMTFDPSTNEFFIKKDALAETIARKTNEPLSEVSQTLDKLSKMEAKSGDSILVFDEETQSWKVDFSILERREEQMKIEEELTKRSEMILETFEQLEKGQITKVPIPDTKEKQTFDYKNEQWNAYNSDKKTKGRSKSPFRESDAEEIRKRNSDLYENLFIGNKKNSRKTEKVAPGMKQHKSPKESRGMLLSESKEKSGTTSQQGSTPLGPEPPKPDPKTPPPENKPEGIIDDNFWGSFINMNILPRDIREIPKLPPPVPPPAPSPISPDTATKIDESSSKKIEEPKFKIRIPFIKDKKPEKEEPPVKGSPKASDDPDKKPPPPPSTADPDKSKKTGVQSPPVKSSTFPKEGPPPPSTADPDKSKKAGVQSPPVKSSTFPKEGPPPKKPPPTIGSSKESTPPEIKASPDTLTKDVQEPKSPVDGKPDKSSAATDHYVSDKIIEISRNKSTENQPKVKANKVETVKLNITSDTRLPSKVTEINLNKKAEEKAKETTAVPAESKPPSESTVKKNDQSTVEKKTFQKTLEKYQTPYGEPDYEEKSMKIKSDLDSNPNLKKLDNWSKTLVLHDIMKPPENIESWLKDETDKMATLLLKVLQEAADGKPKKKQPPGKGKSDKQAGKANPYDNIRKKQETTPEKFLFRVRTVNVSLENDKKKSGENVKLTLKPEQIKEIPVQPEKTGKPSKAMDTIKSPKEMMEKDAHMPVTLEDTKIRGVHAALESAGEFAVMSKEHNHTKLPLEISEEIPGPELLKKISNTWKMFPILGSQMTIFTLLRVFQLVNLGSSILGSSNPDKTRRHAFSKLFLKYGPIVNVQGPLSGNVILIHTPEHLTGVFEQDITTSVRSVFDSLEQCRREAEENGLSVGISTDWSKPEWNDLKRESLDPLLRGGDKYFGLCDAAGDSLVSTVRKNRNAQNFVSEDFMDDIRRWSLEGFCSVIFEKSFGFLEGRTNSASWLLEPDKLYIAIDEATNCLSKCERGFQMWRLMSTPSAMGLSRAYRNISSILSKQLYQAEVNLKRKAESVKNDTSMPVKELTFVEAMLLNDGMTTEEITCNLVDMILIGTNAMNSAMGFLLYNLAQNTKVQMKLFKELKEVLVHKDSPLNYNKVASLSYLQACLKETLRLHFPVPVFYRLLQNDILLANYIVPKGTFVVMDYRVSSMKEQFYDEPDKFIPERWLMDEQWLLNNHPFGAFPLCHGPRADLAKKVVELQLLTCAAKFIRNFHVEYQFGEIQGTDAIISVPDKPLKLNFVEREL